ncbi:hypothetical protein [Agromyces sp. NPDC058110]|uniref:hypothetical protein n=1 Tax=Agromyces sp. NPDC058110 TaxID=3346345 RepID=UPI0036D84812
MPEAPTAPERARTPLKQILVRDVAPVLAVLLITLGLWVGFTIIAPENAVAADPAEPVVVYAAERDSAPSTALAGVRRAALEAALPLRTAVRDLDGFADAALLAEIGAAVGALDDALDGGRPTEILAATADLRATEPTFVERVAADAEARIAAAPYADQPLLQVATEAVAALRQSAHADRGVLVAAFAPVRAAVEAAEADHAAWLDDDWFTDEDSASDGEPSSDPGLDPAVEPSSDPVLDPEAEPLPSPSPTPAT